MYSSRGWTALSEDGSVAVSSPQLFIVSALLTAESWEELESDQENINSDHTRAHTQQLCMPSMFPRAVWVTPLCLVLKPQRLQHTPSDTHRQSTMCVCVCLLVRGAGCTAGVNKKSSVWCVFLCPGRMCCAAGFYLHHLSVCVCVCVCVSHSWGSWWMYVVSSQGSS